MGMDYETLSVADQLLLARDLLRAKESDHYRLSLVEEPNTEARLEELVGQIETLKTKVSDLEGDAPKGAEAPEDEEAAKPKPRARRKTTKKDE